MITSSAVINYTPFLAAHSIRAEFIRQFGDFLLVYLIVTALDFTWGRWSIEKTNFESSGSSEYNLSA